MPPAGEAPSGVRLSKVMSERGICSRREADLWIERGWVLVDGVQVCELGSRIDPAADIVISKEAQRDQAKPMVRIAMKTDAVGKSLPQAVDRKPPGFDGWTEQVAMGEQQVTVDIEAA